MARFLRNFDALSFWLGVLAGALLWFLLGRLRPALQRLTANWKEQVRTSRQDKLLNDRVRLGNDTLRHCQGMHLAAPLFSLDEIIIPPRVLTPAPLPMAYEPVPSEDITDWTIPNTLDSPELASFYNAPSFSLARALQGGANLVIVAEAGNGKTTALAHLASQFVREDPELGELATYIPYLIHIGDLTLPAQEGQEPLTTLLDALRPYLRSIPLKRLPQVLQATFEQNKAILLLDGLDELAPPQMNEAVSFLEHLLKKYPKLRIVTCASAFNLGRLTDIGFYPLALASWKAEQRSHFITQWGNLWNTHIAEQDNSSEKDQEPLLITGWLSNNTNNLTPLELTLKVWAAFAGDSLGPKSIDSIEAYLRRMTFSQPRKNRMALQQLASQMILNMQTVIGLSIAERWLAGLGLFNIESKREETEDHAEQQPINQKDHVRARGALPDLLDGGILIAHSNGQVTLSHILFAAYLSSQDLAGTQITSQLIAQQEWVGKRETLHYLAVTDEKVFGILETIEPDHIDPLLHSLLYAARLLRDVPDNFPWVVNILRASASLLQEDKYSTGLRTRTLSALVFSNNSSVPILLRQLLKSHNPIVQQLACLGCGVLQDTKSAGDIQELIMDNNPGLSRAAILALVAIGDQSSLEAVAYSLLNGKDSLSRAAAEGLANHPEEGYPTLQEGSQMEDPAVRRAVVYGLGRIQESWSLSILEDMRLNDTQWVVQDAAKQALGMITGINPRTPQPHPALTNTSWLINFAGEQGMGVSPGKPALNLLLKALHDGDEDQRLAALYYLRFYGDQSSALPLLETYLSSSSDVREAAFEALILLAAKGIEIPQPLQFGLV